MKAIIVCAGEATRWGGYLGVTKHLAEISGEPILHRTVRLIREHHTPVPGDPDLSIFVVAPAGDDRYNVDGATTFIPTNDPAHHDLNKFLNSRELWETKGARRTLVVYGDVYFTDYAMRTIMTDQHKDWRLYGRAFNSTPMAAECGECFAFSWYPWQNPRMLAACRRVVRLYDEGLIWRTGGWELYRAIICLPDEMMRDHLVSGQCFWSIDDHTEDFDFPEDYMQVKAAVEAAP